MSTTTTWPPANPRRRALVTPPPMPAKIEEDKRASEETLRIMKEIVASLRQQNLNAAVRLAQQAAAGRGDLVEHFAELGRRFGGTLGRAPQKPRSGLRVIEGGAA